MPLSTDLHLGQPDIAIMDLIQDIAAWNEHTKFIKLHHEK